MGHAHLVGLQKNSAGQPEVQICLLYTSIAANLGGQLTAFVQHAGLVGGDRHDHDLDGRDGRGQDQACLLYTSRCV